MHDDRLLVEGRITRLLEERLRPAIHPEQVPLSLEVWHAPGEPVPVAEGLAAAYGPARTGDGWGPAWGTSWFHVTGRIPAAWAGQPVEAVVDLGFGTSHPGFSAEGLVYRPDGSAVKALNPRNTWVRLADAADPQDGQVDLYVEAAANPDIHGDRGARGSAGPVGDVLTAPKDPMYRVRRVVVARFAPEVYELVADVEVADQLMRELSVDDPRRWKLLRALDRAMDAVDLDDVERSAPAARAALAGVLASPASASAHRVSAVGHAHIDSAWLWPLRETVRKVARTCANVTALMDDHPELVYAMSSAQQYAWLAEHRPEVWERVVEKVRAGQFVPVGSMWVESDTNMPGGEALARQLVHGRRFFSRELGVDTPEVWLPDSFGYSAAMPQLVRLAGARWFLTQKISWNQTNDFPHHTFWWEGLDGTRVFTHFPPVDTYNADLTGAEMAHLTRNFADKGASDGPDRSLVPFGFGDGGGGPTREMLARARRLADLEGSARVAVEHPAEFFARAEEEYSGAPVWAGELYLELHRGTYTSQAGTKKGNRRSEHLLHEAEVWSATAAVRAGLPYPHEQLDRLWKTVLLHQFHDILPGSSIAWVHREARETHAAVAAELEGVISGALAALAGEGSTELVANSSPHARGGVPGLAVAVADPATAPGAAGTAGGATRERDGDGWVLANEHLRVEVDARGLVTSVLDLATGREALAPGEAGNLLQLHTDLPAQWDAWDVDPSYRHRVVDLVEADGVEEVEGPGGGAAALRVVRRAGKSTVTQVLSLAPGARRLDVDTEVDWHESEAMLKAAWPLDLRAEVSSSETQFGYVQRPAHTNTSWDSAKFEICAHRYVHVAEPGWGAAVVNDSTYGHDVTRDVRSPADGGDGGTTTTVRLSLLRAPHYPDPETDQGTHRMRYALVVGADLAAATREGSWINLPERRLRGERAVEPLVAAEGDGVVVSALKLADDASGDVVVRLHEALGARTTAHLRWGFDAGEAVVTDLLEDPLGGDDDRGVPLTAQDGGLALPLRPFQVVTLRVPRAS